MTTKDRIANIFPEPGDIPESARIDMPVEQREYLIDGEIRTWDGDLDPVRSPVRTPGPDGPQPTVIGAVPLLGGDEAEDALDAAVRAWDRGRGDWPTMPVEQRIRAVETFAWKMKERREEVVRLLMWEIAKSRADSEKEFDRTVDYILDTIDALKDLDRVSSRFAIESGVIAQIRRAPLGVALCMGPFNYPLNETFTTLIPALIMGNTVIMKPAKYGVLLLRPLLEAFRDAFPPGVVNTVYGDGPTVIGPVMNSGRIDCLAFIGSCGVADILKHQHPQPHRLRSVLGLGAKNAAIVLPDADIEAAAAECVLGSLSFNGQRCTALKLLWIHESAADAFLEKYVAGVEALPFGMPWDDGVRLTPLPEEGKPEKLADMVAEACDAGAEVLNDCGGEINGSYFHPAVVYPVAPGTTLHDREQFGPVVPIRVWKDIDEPVRWVEESPYGQQAAVFGRDAETIARLVDPMVNQVCRVNVNSQCQRGPDTFPFTGRKDSAEGTLSVSDALRVFSIRTLVAAKETDANRAILSSIVKERSSSFLSTDFIF